MLRLLPGAQGPSVGGPGWAQSNQDCDLRSTKSHPHPSPPCFLNLERVQASGPLGRICFTRRPAIGPGGLTEGPDPELGLACPGEGALQASLPGTGRVRLSGGSPGGS